MEYQSEIGIFSTQLAKGSFLIGTALLLLGFAFPGSPTVWFLGFFFVIIAAFLNLLMLLALAACCFALWHRREYYAVKILIVTANIPVAILYFFLIMSIRR